MFYCVAIWKDILWCTLVSNYYKDIKQKQKRLCAKIVGSSMNLVNKSF